MAGIVTQTRGYGSPQLSYWAGCRDSFSYPTYSGTDNLWADSSSGYKGTFQKTTSYRSGRSYLKALQDPNTIYDRADVPAVSGEAALDGYDPLKYFAESKSSNGSHDTGHAFSTEKHSRSLTHVSFRSGGAGNIFYTGDVIHNASEPTGKVAAAWDKPLLPSWDSTSMGNKAISLTIPTLPVAGLSAFLGELHEGLPKMIGHSSLFADRAHAFRGAGSEYLNIEFGWKPFVSDVEKFVHAFTNAGKLLKQYRRDSGKQVRRQRVFKTERSIIAPPVFTGDPWSTFKSCSRDGSAASNLFYPQQNWNGMFVTGATPLSTYASALVTQAYKFTGCYSYLVSEDDSFLGRMERYEQLGNKLLGIKLTPDVLWELTPWSWLADWELNIGVNISNATAFGQDNLALRWGYLQRHTTIKQSYITPDVRSYSGWQGTVRTYSRYEKKERVQSTPFGFGLNTANFTDRQWAILGALGLTKAPKVLF